MKLAVPKAMVDLRDKLGRPIKDLRVSITDRCNFRCPYCMPAEVYGHRYQFLSKADTLSFEEITRVVRIFVDLGVTTNSTTTVDYTRRARVALRAFVRSPFKF